MAAARSYEPIKPMSLANMRERRSVARCVLLAHSRGSRRNAGAIILQVATFLTRNVVSISTQAKRIVFTVAGAALNRSENNASRSGHATMARSAQEFPRRMEYARDDLRRGPSPGASVHSGRPLKRGRQNCWG